MTKRNIPEGLEYGNCWSEQGYKAGTPCAEHIHCKDCYQVKITRGPGDYGRRGKIIYTCPYFGRVGAWGTCRHAERE